jgi:hypothetical protein
MPTITTVFLSRSIASLLPPARRAQAKPCRSEIFLPEWREVRANAIYIRTRHGRTGGRQGPPAATGGTEGQDMGRIIKIVVVLVIFGFIGLTGYAYLADLTPEQTPVSTPVVLNAD